MYNFTKELPRKRYGRVKRGWHSGRIYQLSVKNHNASTSRQYIKEDIEILEEEFKDIIVPAFFNYKKIGKADYKFICMGKAAGLSGDYGNDLNAVFNELLGKELLVFVVHKYKKKSHTPGSGC